MPHIIYPKSNIHWIKLRTHIQNLPKQKYIIGIIYTFLYELNIHIRETINSRPPDNKFDYLVISNNIYSLQQKLHKIKQTLNITNHNFLLDRDNLNILLEFYLSIITLIENYGGPNCIAIINIYLVLYCEIIQLIQFYKPYRSQPPLNSAHISGNLEKHKFLDNLATKAADLQSHTGVNTSLANNKKIKYDAESNIQPNAKLNRLTNLQNESQPRLSSSLPDKISNITTTRLSHFENYETSSSDSSITTSSEDEQDTTGVSLNSHPLNVGLELSVNGIQDIELATIGTNISPIISQSMAQSKKVDIPLTLKTNNLQCNNLNAIPFNLPFECASATNLMLPNKTNPDMLESVYLLYNSWVNRLCRTKQINPFHTLPVTIQNYITNNKPINVQYLDLINNVIKPMSVNVMFDTNDAGGYPTINNIKYHLDRIISANGGQFVKQTSKSRLSVYPAYLESLGSLIKHNIYIGNINNPGIISTIKNYEIIKDNLVHVIIPLTLDSIGGKAFTLYIVINGYIGSNQDLLLVQKYPFVRQKFELIQQHIISISELNMNYKKLICRTLSLKQILCSSITDIIKYVCDYWNIYTKTMTQSITDMITSFINSSTRHKYNILYALLLNHTNFEALFRAQLLWSMLVNEHNMSFQQMDIFDKLHPELLCLLTNIYSLDITEPSIKKPKPVSYEKQIELSQADNATKQKMQEKLKEINNKNNDNISKAQQYLDGLLAIPFGKYARESIIQDTDKYNDRLILFITNLIILCIDNSIDYTICTEFLSICGQVLNISQETISSLHNIDDDILLESIIMKLLRAHKLKPSFDLKQLFDALTDLMSHRLPITPDAIDTFYIKTMLDHIDPNHINDIVDSYNSITEDYNVKSLLDLLDQIDNDSSSKQILLSILIQEGHFIDAGYPYVLDIYCSQLKGFIQEYNTLQIKKRDYLTGCYNRLNESIYGQHDAKNQILRILGQWLNGNQGGYCLGFEGSPGIGKTSLAKYGISQALIDADGNARPFGFIALGGSSNGSTLEGHSYTYVGSTWGRIVDILITSKCMNPIIFIDELDKISNTESGRELIGILTHLTDKTQNNEFMDKYFAGVKIDLSQVLFIFSYNDYAKLDSILADRIHRIQFDNYTNKDKITICNDYLIPKISSEINITDFEPRFDQDVLNYLIDSYTHEAGVRKLKEKLYDILREINIKHIRGELTYPGEQLIITRDLVDDILSTYYKIDIAKPFHTPRIGIVYGLYATSMGTGGITIIQVTNKYIDSGSSLLFTGKPGDVMQESMRVSLTLAANILPKSILEKWGILESTNLAKPNKFGVHIHCPDGSTPKDGPSAGCAFTLGLISLLTEIPVKNTISMTGEIDIMGHILPIGGLDSKIQGSTRAGIFNILVPIDNKRDIDRIRVKQPEILSGVTIIFTTTIQDVINHGLTSTIPI